MAETTHRRSGHAVYDDLHASPEFRELRTRYRSFAFPFTAAFLGWYLLYVVMSNWASGLMNTKVIGHVNVALVFGLLQFVSTFAIAILYARHASRHFDPLAAELTARYDEEIGR
jgi:uncharacterized membrane protein (DUF485 family)